MEELAAAFAPLGFDDVVTWQATGNVAFATDPGAALDDLEDRIATVLAQELAIEVPTIVRTAEQVRALAAATPFAEGELAQTERRVQLLFVLGQPDPTAVAALLEEHGSEDDLLRWGERELWWLPRAGVSDSRLRVGVLERALGVTTLRTHRAVAGLVTRHL